MSSISDLKNAREELIAVIDKISDDKRTIIFIGTWSLKDMIAHLTGWAEHQINTLRYFSKGEIPSRSIDSNLFNEEIVRLSRSQSWEQIYSEFQKSSLRLIHAYQKLPDTFWDKQIWTDKSLTPKEYIMLEITHYRKTHLPQIQNLLDV